jgi:excisionase family DNA binding protein
VIGRRVTIEAAALTDIINAALTGEQRSRIPNPELRAAIARGLASSAPMPPPPPEFLTVAEAAGLYRVNRKTVLRWIDRGELDAERKDGTIRIPANRGQSGTNEDTRQVAAPPVGDSPTNDHGGTSR